MWVISSIGSEQMSLQYCAKSSLTVASWDTLMISANWWRYVYQCAVTALYDRSQLVSPGSAAARDRSLASSRKRRAHSRTIASLES